MLYEILIFLFICEICHVGIVVVRLYYNQILKYLIGIKILL
jgi:hypothetical protein